MKKLATIVIVCGLVATACAEGEPAASDGDAPTTSPTTSVTETTTAPTTNAPDATSTTSSPEQPTGGDVSELLDRVANAPDPTSGRMEVTVTITGLEAGAAGGTEASFGFSTAFDTEQNVSSFVMDLSSLADAVPTDDQEAELLAAFSGTMEVRVVDDTAYVKMPFFTELLGLETPWMSMPADQGEGFTSDFSTVPADPSDVIAAYDGADTTVEDLGVEEVNGVEATHYRVTFDTTTWLDELSEDERAELEASGLLADGVLPMDIWVTSEGHLIRLVFELDGSTLDLPPGEGFSSMTMRYDMLEIGQPVTVVAPPDSDVTPVDELGFGEFDFGVGT